MEISDEFLKWVEVIFTKEWFQIGETSITLSTILGLILILIFVNWIGKLVEKLIKKK